MKRTLIAGIVSFVLMGVLPFLSARENVFSVPVQTVNKMFFTTSENGLLKMRMEAKMSTNFETILIFRFTSSSESSFIILPVFPIIISPPLTLVPGDIIPSTSNFVSFPPRLFLVLFLSGLSNFSSLNLLSNLCSEI